MVSSFGLIFRLKILRTMNMYSIMRAIGGEGYLMEMEFIRKLMVMIFVTVGDMYTGSFKNGLKHG